MFGLRPLVYRVKSWLRRRDVTVWYSPAYRLPLSGLELSTGLEPRRADFVAWWLLRSGAAPASSLRSPPSIPFADLDRVHTLEFLESLGRPETLARIFAVDPSDVPIDELLHSARLACGGTLGAARETLRTRAPALNLLGGFHHAGPASAGGFCPIDDVAVALAALRAEGFAGTAVVLDLDAHPPDGIAACLAGDAPSWIGSISGSDWGPLPGRVDETVLPEGAGDALYLQTLEALLGRMPRPDLAFVLAGGDVLAGDRFGQLGLTLDGALRRDLRVALELEGVPSVWLPAGGYSPSSWRVFAGTGTVVATGSLDPIPADYDPLQSRFADISATMNQEALGESGDLSAADLEEALGLRPRRDRLLLGYYTRAGMEHALYRYGILDHLGRLGYDHFRVKFDGANPGERFRLFARSRGQEELLLEFVYERRRVAGREVLYVHWASLRNPRAQFSDKRPRLPGQEVPGLGMAREAGEMTALMARRLGLAGVAFRPAWYHTAFGARHNFTFVDPLRQGRFEAMVRDLAGLPLRESTLAVADGRILMNGQPYAWEADEMAFWLEPAEPDAARVAAERDRVHFDWVRPAAAPTA
ncbi:MAG TPA: histone deacetylase [Anaeromyxobacteraceae bacterium]|jgi:acetoin utilization deacetylase AcuC-like enzyme|nr:histone deacetylase [Anaeromyxobacteraceae bacterium]